jgi:hypothetical protein
MLSPSLLRRAASDLVGSRLSPAQVWKSLKRQEAQRFLTEVIREHRYHA